MASPCLLMLGDALLPLQTVYWAILTWSSMKEQICRSPVTSSQCPAVTRGQSSWLFPHRRNCNGRWGLIHTRAKQLDSHHKWNTWIPSKVEFPLMPVSECLLELPNCWGWNVYNIEKIPRYGNLWRCVVWTLY